MNRANGEPDRRWLSVIWGALDARSRDMLAMSDVGRTLESIGRDHGVTRERARQIIKSAARRLSEIARLYEPEWFASISDLLDGQVVVSDEALSAYLPDDTGVVRAVLLTSEGLCHPRTWSGEMGDHWARGSDALDKLLEELAAAAPYRKEELRQQARLIGIPRSVDIESIMLSQKSPLVYDPSEAWVRRSAKKRDAAFLWLGDQGEPRKGDSIAEAVSTNTHALTESLRRDDRFRQVRPEGTWALASWPLDGISEHSNALDVVIEVLRDLGPLSRRELFQEVRRRYPVSQARVQQCLLSERIGQTQDGRVGLIEQGALETEESEPRRPSNAIHDEYLGLLAFRIVVDKDVIRGSGIIIHPWITWRLGLRQAPMSRTFTLEGSDRQVTLRRGTSGAQMSSLRLEALEHEMALGCELAIVLRIGAGTSTIRHVCEPAACPAVASV